MKKFLFILILLLALPAKAKTIGWITDIHIGTEKQRETETSIVYPKKSLKYFLSYAKRHPNQTLLITGDISHKGRKKDIANLRKTAKKYKINLLLVRGNHDRGAMPETFYSTVIGEHKLIVLDSNYSRYAGSGEIYPNEMSWLENELKTDLPVIIAMHHPVFHRSTGEFLPVYADFMKLLEGSTVKTVVSGHQHKDFYKELNNITFQTQRPFFSAKGISYDVLNF